MGYFFKNFQINFLKQEVHTLCKNDEILESVPTGRTQRLTGGIALGVGVPYGKCIVGPVGCRGAACRNKLRTCVYP